MALEIPEDVFEGILQFVPTDLTTLQNVQLSSKKFNSIINKPAFWESRIKNFFNLIDIDTDTQECVESLDARKIIDEFGVAEYLRRRRQWSHLSLLSEWKQELFWRDGIEDNTRKIFTTPFEYWKCGIAHKKGQFSSFEGWSLSKIKRFIGDLTFLREFGNKIREVKHQSESEYSFLPFIIEGDELSSEEEAGAVENSEVLDAMEACDTLKDNSSHYYDEDEESEAEPTEEEEEQADQSEEVTKVKQAQVEINGEWKKVFDVCEKDILQLLKTYAGKPEEKVVLFQAGRGQVNPFPVYAVVRSKTGNYVGALAGSMWT